VCLVSLKIIFLVLFKGSQEFVGVATLFELAEYSETHKN